MKSSKVHPVPCRTLRSASVGASVSFSFSLGLIGIQVNVPIHAPFASVLVSLISDPDITEVQVSDDFEVRRKSLCFVVDVRHRAYIMGDL